MLIFQSGLLSVIPFLFQCDNHIHRHSRASGNLFGGSSSGFLDSRLRGNDGFPGRILVVLKWKWNKHWPRLFGQDFHGDKRSPVG